MSFNPNIPQPTDQLKNSQSDLLGNFSALAPFGNGYANLPQQVAIPSVTSTNLAVYNYNSTYTSLPALFLATNTTGPFEFSSTQTATTGSQVESWTRLPSGVLVKWGYSTSNFTAGSNTWTFNVSFPVFISAPLILLTPYTNSGGSDPNCMYYVQSSLTTGFNVWGTPRTTGSTTYYSPTFIAIGV